MEFSKEDLLKLAEQLSDFNEIDLIDIPSIDLYMDQVTTLFENKLSHQKRVTKEPILTKTMINNYAKAKLLTPIKNKKYSRQQIITLILIYNLKQILSLDDINSLFAPLTEELSKGRTTQLNMEGLYLDFLNIKKQHCSSFETQVSDIFELINNLDTKNAKNDNGISSLILTVLALIDSANTQKRLAEKLIDVFCKNIKEQ
jgi:hypothetical protein